jgi:hypothetical protein
MTKSSKFQTEVDSDFGFGTSLIVDLSGGSFVAEFDMRISDLGFSAERNNVSGE